MLRNRPISETWLVFVPLALVGGFLDSYSFICRGGILANAITGDLVYMGISIAQGDYFKALLSVIVIVSYGLGVLAAMFLSTALEKNRHSHWRQWVLFVEMVVLIVVAFLHGSQFDIIVNILIAFLCAMQVQGFRKIMGVTAATTMCTGNLRSGAEEVFRFFSKKDKKNLRNASVFFIIIGIFAVGVIIGAFLSKLCGEYASLFCAGTLFIVSVLLIFEKKNTAVQ